LCGPNVALAVRSVVREDKVFNKPVHKRFQPIDTIGGLGGGPCDLGAVS